MESDDDKIDSDDPMELTWCIVGQAFDQHAAVRRHESHGHLGLELRRFRRRFGAGQVRHLQVRHVGGARHQLDLLRSVPLVPFSVTD